MSDNLHKPDGFDRECQTRYGVLRRQGIKAGLLFANFFLIIMALYQLKPPSRSFFISELGAGMLPYAWIGTAAVMLVVIRWYNALVERVSRLNVVLGTCAVVVAMLLGFRLWLADPGPWGAALFFIFVDVIGVLLVEQFWCLADSIYTTAEGKSWYGLIGTGGLVGGVVSGASGAVLIKATSLQTPDLLLVGAGIVAFIFGLTWYLGKCGVYCETENPAAHASFGRGLGAILKSRYLMLIAGLLLAAQVASQFIEFQFLHTVQISFDTPDARTAYLSGFFSVLSFISIGINLGVTPLVHRKLGAIAGLVFQPVLMGLASFFFWANPVLWIGAAAKISDRGLSYSISRASKELLYVPISPVVIYQAKAWIDMFGYRVFKVLGSLVILIFTQWLPDAVSPANLSWFTIATCLGWTWLVLAIRREYQDFVLQER